MASVRSSILIFFCFFLTSISSFGQSANDGGFVKSYRQWKEERIDASEDRVTQAKLQLTRVQIEGQKEQVQSFERHLHQEQWGLEVARDLSVTDYIALYLGQQSSPSRFLQAASQMTDSEVSELIEAYAREMGAFPEAKGPKVSVDAQNLKILGK